MKKAIADSIETWAKKGLQNTTSFLPQNSIWKVDEFLFNADRTKIFGWILQVDTEQLSTEMMNSDRDDILDYVEYFAGEKKDGNWKFYTHHMPKLWFARKNNNGQPYSFEYLSQRAKQKVAEGGLIKNRKCIINYNYINEWIDREGTNFSELHKTFLNSGNNN